MDCKISLIYFSAIKIVLKMQDTFSCAFPV